MKWFRPIFILIFLSNLILCEGQITNVYNELRNFNFKIPATDTIIGWKREGNFSLNFGQSHYESWVQSNNSKLDFSTRINQRIYYHYRKSIWDNQILLQYGMRKLYDQNFQKSADRLEINSIFGRVIGDKISFSLFANFRTQFTNTYNFNKDEDRNYRISGIMSPSYLKSGVGIMWRRDNNLYLNLAPATWQMVSIISPVYKYDNNKKKFMSSNEVEVFGIDRGESFTQKVGFNASLFHKFTLFKKLTIENRLALYSNYIYKPLNIDIDYIFTSKYKINKYISTNLMAQALYDDNAYAGFQIKENFSIGINFKL